MNEYPILFKAPMVRAVLAGTKAQTRRIVMPGNGEQRRWLTLRGITLSPRLDICRSQFDDPMSPMGASMVHPGRGGGPLGWVRSPYGEPGDHLWVKETWHPCDSGSDLYAADYESKEQAGIERWKPSIFMTRAASRITLEITNLRVERLQQISGADILAEGVVLRSHQDQNLGKCPISAFDGCMYPDLRSLWIAGWNSINGKRAPWSMNCWVWVVEFRRIKASVARTA